MNGAKLKEKLSHRDYKNEIFTKQEVEDTMKTDPTDVV